ncbi:hypothetical protein CWB76_02005 [Pseudoalteromonas sp. S1609]|uniref:hypothetical protein n=1 Tax=Pseudoalteromonas sp. S1609 TaxID=579505 RepID=UPI00110AE62A|nr:hypothetical protein [Pseudoalteromonas sp. S1609]TMP72746.1 hypothetical protein CWB76_02005 [Pseudoalteromonas sp. S1609]
MTIADKWAIIGSVAGVFSFLLALYVYMASKRLKKKTEDDLIAQNQKLSSLSYQITAALHSVDSIVQATKDDAVPPIAIGQMARIARGQIYTVSKQLEQEGAGIKSWRHGKMVKSLNRKEPA